MAIAPSHEDDAAVFGRRRLRRARAQRRGGRPAAEAMVHVTSRSSLAEPAFGNVRSKPSALSNAGLVVDLNTADTHCSNACGRRVVVVQIT